MRRRPAAVVLAAALLTTAAPLATAAPPAPDGAGLTREAPTLRDAAAQVAPDSTAAAVPPRDRVLPYPRQQVLEEPPVNPDDRSIKLGLAPYHSIAPTLNDLQEASDRVSVEVIGQSVQGRDLHLVTVTNPETRGQAQQQETFRRRIEERPALAARDRNLAARYKAPVFVNGNIHGNEWEGADANLRVIADLATSTDAETDALLDHNRLYFVVTMNPDGRVAGTRANGNGFDMNRDFITVTQPEVSAVRQALIDTQPLVMLDLHGYVNGTLIEPTTPPHGENYEYDLFIKHAYPNGLAMEAAVNGLGYTEEADGVIPVQIPFRDFPEGWDDWPPIFTPQYAAFHGAISHTIEIPLRVNGANYDTLPVEELQRRSAINTDVAEATVVAAVDFTDTNRAQLIADQIEVFRRGEAGEAQREVPLDYFGDGTVGPEDIYTTEFPRAYVVPVGDGQRSAPAAARLVDHLVANDVEVGRTSGEETIGGVTYPAGSYVVDMHQAKRGLANVMLAAGRDISPDVDTMYDISGWSLRQLWGADVAILEEGELEADVRPVAAADPTGSVTGDGDLALQLDDAADFRALDALLDAGTPVSWTSAGEVVVAAADRALAEAAAEQYGVAFTAASVPGEVPLDAPVVAAAAPPDELFALDELGFDVRPVTNATAPAFAWDEVDALYVSSGLTFTGLGAAGQAAVQAWLADGGGVVARGSTGANFNRDFGLLTATRVAGRSDANGVVTVDNAGGPLTADALATSFVTGPSWFTGLGAEVTVEQAYTEDGPLVSGHWRDREDGTGGQDDARGQAVLIRGVDETGSAVAAFGSEPLYRAHPKGLYAQVGRALYWSATVSDLG